MVTKKKSVKKKAKKKPGKAMATMEQFEKRMVEAAEDQSAKEAVGSGDNISTRGGKFTFQGQNLGTAMDVVILGFAHTRGWYDRDFDAEDPCPPACFCVTEDGKDEVPHDTSPKPQAETCEECEFDAWGSAEKGRGKRCKQHRKLIVMSYDGSIPDVEEALVATVSVPSASLKNWKGYIKKIENTLNRPCFGVATKLFFDPDAEYDTICFEMAEVIKNAKTMEAVYTLKAEHDESLLQPIDVSGYTEPVTKKKAGKKKAKKKKSKSKKFK